MTKNKYKIKKEFNKEYIPVYIAIVILILFIILLVFSIMYEHNIEVEEGTTTSDVLDEDLTLYKDSSTCSTEELNTLTSDAGKITVDYEFTKETEENTEEWIEENLGDISEEELNDYYPDGTHTTSYININVYNITENVYVTIENDYNDNVVLITYDSTTDGKYTFHGEAYDEVIEYTMYVYSVNESCYGELLRNAQFETLMYNEYYYTMKCIEYPNYDACSLFVEEEISYSDFSSGLEKYIEENPEESSKSYENAQKAVYDVNIIEELEEEQEEEEEKENDTIVNKVSNNKKLLIIAFAIIGIGVLVIILLMFIRRNKI